MAERDDPGVAEDEIKRQREQDHDQRLAAKDHLIWKDEERRHRGEPRQHLGSPPAVAADQHGGGARAGGCDLAAGRELSRFTRVHKVPPA